MKRTRYLLIPALGLIAMAVVIASTARDLTGSVEPTTVPHFEFADVRVQITDEPVVSRHQDPVYVQLEYGEIPPEVTHLTVLTDENCMPDEDGISHCLNRVEFETAEGRQEAGLRHHHNMSEVPCLAPTQTLELVH